MNRSFSPAALLIALLLHVGLIAWVIILLQTPASKPTEPVSMAVQLLPAKEEPLAEPATFVPPAPPPPPAPAPPEQKPIEVKPPPKPKSKPVAKPRIQREQPTEESKTAPAPAPASPEPVQATRPAPVATSEAQSAPATPAPSIPARTGVYIPAEYAASNRKPVYPSMSKRYGEQGTVMLHVFVKADGTAGQVEIRSSSGYPLLDESARTAVQGWRFQPATSDGKPIGDWFLIPIPFKLQN